MFKKRKCKNCDRKINNSYDFCPHCGNSFNDNTEGWGMLGKTDNTNEFEQFSNSLFGGVGGKIIGGMLGKTLKMLEHEIQKETKTQNNTPKTNFELIINGKRINPKDIKLSQQRQVVKKQRKVFPNISNDSLKKISTLPKKEPLTNIRRFADKVIYEINMPGVNSVNDISIISLESSIEIKALADKTAYFKVIPISLPITNYKFLDEKLILELEIKN